MQLSDGDLTVWEEIFLMMVVGMVLPPLQTGLLKRSLHYHKVSEIAPSCDVPSSREKDGTVMVRAGWRDVGANGDGFA